MLSFQTEVELHCIISLELDEAYASDKRSEAYALPATSQGIVT